MPRFVILEHDHPYLHWDFMMEEAGVLKTWRLPGPPWHLGDELKAQAIGDHRLAYLDYEGPVSGGRGIVTRCDSGTYQTMDGDAMNQRHLRLQGRRCSGTVILAKQGDGAWTFTYSPEGCPPNSTKPRLGPEEA